MLIAYGLINIGGGIFAFTKYQSTMSLAVGLPIGIIFVSLGLMAKKTPSTAYRAAGVFAFAMVAFWVYRLWTVSQEGGKTMMPMMNLVLSALVLITLTMAHFAAQKHRQSGT